MKHVDLHALYEEAVQSPDEEVEFITGVYRRHHRRFPRTLREDFCGTAILAAKWAESRPERTAVGVDLDPRVLAYAKQKHVAALDEKAQRRIRLIERDVRQRDRERFDCICAYNYSWWIFKERRDLLAYFQSVRASLATRGLFFLDIFGGSTSQQTNLEPRKYRGFEYTWEQASFNPLDNAFQAYIHFEMKDGRRFERAFSYDWRLWHVSEARDVLKDAGFSSTEIYWEDSDARGEPNGHFRPRKVVENEPSWNAYIIAKR